MKERVRAIIKQNADILLIHRTKRGHEYWTFPGGGVEKTDKDKKAALVRECREELGIEVRVDSMFASYLFSEAVENQREYFYLCEITHGVLGTGTGPEFEAGSSYKGGYALEWIPLEDFSTKNIQPDEIKSKLLKESF